MPSKHKEKCAGIWLWALLPDEPPDAAVAILQMGRTHLQIKQTTSRWWSRKKEPGSLQRPWNHFKCYSLSMGYARVVENNYTCFSKGGPRLCYPGNFQVVSVSSQIQYMQRQTNFPPNLLFHVSLRMLLAARNRKILI